MRQIRSDKTLLICGKQVPTTSHHSPCAGARKWLGGRAVGESARDLRTVIGPPLRRRSADASTSRGSTAFRPYPLSHSLVSHSIFFFFEKERRDEFQIRPLVA